MSQIKLLNNKLEEQKKEFKEQFISILTNIPSFVYLNKNEFNEINKSIKKIEMMIPVNSSQIINNQLINTIIEKDKKIEKLINDKFNDDLELVNDEQNDINNIEENKPMNLILNNQIIQYRESDNYVNATQLCECYSIM